MCVLGGGGEREGEKFCSEDTPQHYTWLKPCQQAEGLKYSYSHGTRQRRNSVE